MKFKQILEDIENLKTEFATLYDFVHICPICANFLEVIHNDIICDELAKDWNLSPLQKRFFNYREGCQCKNCSSSMRAMNLGKVIMEIVNLKYNQNIQFFKDIIDNKQFRQLSIAEVNNCGPLHHYLKRHPNLSYSEFNSTISGISSENLMKLSYKNDTFCLVIMSDVLEHVPDYNIALTEINRVLKTQGVFIFTVPYLIERPTVIRAKKSKEETINIKKGSYHGDYFSKQKDLLVFYEFGYDFVFKLKKMFKTSIYAHTGYSGLIASIFVCEKWSSLR
ncbi:MAG: methyltransferase domain-containing protein [Candidatus Aminicenantes bacterium]|nr:methyltransferase domain-containing protein [Candidatus Aminicenantes bacterium]